MIQRLFFFVPYFQLDSTLPVGGGFIVTSWETEASLGKCTIVLVCEPQREIPLCSKCSWKENETKVSFFFLVVGALDVVDKAQRESWSSMKEKAE